MKRWAVSLCILLMIMSSISFTIGEENDEMTDLDYHLNQMQERLSKGEELYDEFTKPGPFNVELLGIDEATNGPVFHVTFLSREHYSDYLDFVFKFDITYYVDGQMFAAGATVRNDKTEVVESVEDEGSYYYTVQHDYELVFNNPDDDPIKHKFTFALTKISYSGGYIMFAMNDTSFNIDYDPKDYVVVEDGQEGSGYKMAIEDQDSDATKKGNKRNTLIYGLLGAMGGSAALVLHSRKKKVKIRKKITQKDLNKLKEEERKLEAQKKASKGLFKTLRSAIKKVGTTAVKGLKQVSKTLTGTYESIKKLGIETGMGRLELGDITSLTGANKIMDIVKSVEDVCDVINKHKDIKDVWKNAVGRLIDAKMNKLKNIIGKGLKLDSKKLNKLININKEINTIKGLMKDGVKLEELLDLDEKLRQYKAGPTEVEQLQNHVNKHHDRLQKGSDIERENFKKVMGVK